MRQNNVYHSSRNLLYSSLLLCKILNICLFLTQVYNIISITDIIFSKSCFDQCSLKTKLLKAIKWIHFNILKIGASGTFTHIWTTVAYTQIVQKKLINSYVHNRIFRQQLILLIQHIHIFEWISKYSVVFLLILVIFSPIKLSFSKIPLLTVKLPVPQFFIAFQV